MKGHGSDLDPTNRRTTMTNRVILTTLTLAALSLSTAARTQDGPRSGADADIRFRAAGCR